MFNVTTSSGWFGYEDDWICQRKIPWLFFLFIQSRQEFKMPWAMFLTNRRKRHLKANILTVITVMCCGRGCCLEQKTTIGPDKIKISTWPTCWASDLVKSTGPEIQNNTSGFVSIIFPIVKSIHFFCLIGYIVILYSNLWVSTALCWFQNCNNVLDQCGHSAWNRPA